MGESLRSASDYAAWFAERGFRVFPLKPLRKRPFTEKWQTVATKELSEVQELFSSEDYNLGVVADDLVVIDVDNESHGGKAGPDSLRKLLKENGSLPPTFTVRTASGGVHLYFRKPKLGEKETIRKGADKLGEGLDIQTGNAYLVGPGSVLDGGDESNPQVAGRYDIIYQEELAELPRWVVDLILTPEYVYEEEDLDGYVPQADVIRAEKYYIDILKSMSDEGWQGRPWDQTTFWVACCLIELVNEPNNRYPEGAARNAFFANAPTDDGFDAERHEEKWRSAVTKVGGRGRRATAFSRRKSTNLNLAEVYTAWDNLLQVQKSSPVVTKTLEKALEMYLRRSKYYQHIKSSPSFPDIWDRLVATLAKVETDTEGKEWLTKAKLVVDKLGERFDTV